MKLMLFMFFLAITSVNVSFIKNELIWKIYTIENIFLITYKIKLIDKNQFIKTILDGNIKVFITYINKYGARMTIDLGRKAYKTRW